MPRNDPNDLRPPIPYKLRHVPRPLTKGEIKAAADRAEARAMRTQLSDDPANCSTSSKRRTDPVPR